MYNENEKNGIEMPDNSVPDMGNNTAAENQAGGIHNPINGGSEQQSIQNTEPINRQGITGTEGVRLSSSAETTGQPVPGNHFGSAGQSAPAGHSGTSEQTSSAGYAGTTGQSVPASHAGTTGQTPSAGYAGAVSQPTPASHSGTASQPAPQNQYVTVRQPVSAGGAGEQNSGWQQRGPQPLASNRKPEHSSPKKKSLGGRIAGITAAALLFGTVAGGTMVGINTAAEHFKQESSAQTSITEGVSESAAVEAPPETTAQASAPQVSKAVAMDVSDIVEKAMPSVVAINNTMIYQSQNWFGQQQTYEVPSSGSGIIVGQNDEELLIVTNNHVVEDSKTLTVTFIDNSSVDASIKGTDSETDLAVIAVPLAKIESDTMSQIEVATLGDSDSLKVGQGVIAIGNALGYGQSVTVGYVSAIDREVKTENNVTRNLLQTDAAINPGNSGGALLNMNGEVIGINAAKYSSTEVEGMGYAIPISKANEIINELMNKKTRVEVAEANQGYLGIQGQNIDETAAEMYGMPKGIYVFKIVEGGAAADSDLREKDIITKFDGQTVRTMADLKSMLTYYEGGSTITLTVQSLQDGQYVERTVDITLGMKPQTEVN